MMHWIGIISTKLNLTPICDITRIMSCRKITAITESIQSNACYAVRDGDRGEGGAIIESPLSNGRDGVRDCDRGERFALVESLLTNARHWTIEGDDTLAVLVLVAYDICAEDIGFIRCNDIAIGGGIGNNTSYNRIARIIRASISRSIIIARIIRARIIRALFYERTHMTSPP